MDTGLRQSNLPFKLNRADVADGRVPAYGGVEPLNVTEHLGPHVVASPIDCFADALGFQRREEEKLRCDPIALIAMTFIDMPAGSAELICRNRAPQICRPCADRHARDGASGAVPKHWRKTWRITCPACGAPLSDTSERPDSGETLRDTSPFADVWKEAVAGEAIVERFLHGDNSFDYSPIALMRALLVHTWRPCGTNGRDPAAGWALGTIFPEFDNLARPIKRTINHAAVEALPISLRPALLAGVSRTIASPVILKAVRDETSLRGRRAFERLCETARLEAQAVRESH